MLRPNSLRTILVRHNADFKRYKFPTTFEHVVFPPDGQMKLPQLPMEPYIDVEAGERKYKTTERMIEARGVEEIHNSLIHKQYGLAAISGGFLRPTDFKLLLARVNSNLMKNQFAVWRVDPPWLPRTKKAQGVKLGGGKGSIHHYVTPVRAGRIILELGGHITEQEAYAYLAHIPDFIQFPIEFISEEILQHRREEERQIQMYNKNRFNWDYVIKYNLQDCCSWLSQYDIMWRGKYK